MIRHTVAFTLRHEPCSPEEAAFLRSADALGLIPGVEKFEKLRQISQKNGCAFGFSIEFSDMAAYTFYNEHSDHVAFVQGRWIPDVSDFMEIDYNPLL